MRNGEPFGFQHSVVVQQQINVHGAALVALAGLFTATPFFLEVDLAFSPALERAVFDFAAGLVAVEDFTLRDGFALFTFAVFFAELDLDVVFLDFTISNEVLEPAFRSKLAE